MTIFKKIINIAEWIVCIVILALCLLVAAPILPTRYKIQPFVVITGSMKPNIQIGSVAFVQNAPYSDLKKGDIIAFENPGNKSQVIIHRMVNIKPTVLGNRAVPFFITKGDANSSKDVWEVVPGAIKGKYITSIPYLGYALTEVKKPLGFLLIIGIPSIVLIFIFAFQLVVGILEEMRKKRSEENKPIKTPHTVVGILIFLFLPLSIFSYKTINALWLKNIDASGISISAKDFVPPPVPLLRSPANNTIMNSAGLQQTWQYVVDEHGSNPVTYYYESCGVDPQLYAGQICPAGQVRYTATYTIANKQTIGGEERIVKNASGAPDGIFWWRVQAIDTVGNRSAWSEVWKLTLDSTKPLKPQVKTIYKGHNSSTWTEVGCGGFTNDTHITIEWYPSTDPNIDYYWFGTKSNTKHAKVYHPTTQYFGNMTPGNNPYSYTIIAVDKAGNESVISNSCGLTLDQVAPSSLSLSIEGSYTKAVEEKFTNGGLESGLTGWTTAGDVAITTGDIITQPFPETDLVINPYDGSSSMARIGNYAYPSDEGNKVWENRLMQSVSGGAKGLSLHYNYASYDNAFDDPGFFIRLNGQEIFKTDPSVLSTADFGVARNTGWQQFSYDLSDYANSDKLNLAIYAGNTTDNTLQSWAYVDAITTYFVSAPGHATYTLVGSDALSGINHYEYRIGGESWQQTSSTFQVTEHGDHWVEYYAVDNAGNNSSIYRVQVITDNQAPATINDLGVAEIRINTATLTWTSPGNNGSSGRAAKYDIRYSTSPIITEDNFNSATSAGKIPVPQEAGLNESVEILGLNPSTAYYFAIRAADEAPNWSGIDTTTGTTTALAPLTSVTAGDIVINELMWMGTSVSTADEWIELRNMTDRTIDLSGFKIQKYNGTTYADMVTLPSSSVAPHSYFLITNYAPGTAGSQLKSSVTADLVTTSVALAAGHLQLQLTDPLSNVLDTAWDYTYDLSTGEGEGLYDAIDLKYYSMERTSVPGIGMDPLNWYSCIDSASRTEFFTTGTVGSDVRGTPRTENRSENEPLAHLTTSVRPTPTVSATPEATLTLADDRKTVSFSVQNIADYDKLSYELSYDAFSIAKGLVGSDVDISSLDKYEKTDLDLATCSGEVCTYDTDVKNVKLIIILTDKDGVKITLEENL
ncbi:signal peptidase I [Candidatus Roizmanbacteria bacterium CG_4_10_14_0_8_um_filter_39_9]|uniref:Signal peptidase I n=1 Tax=Candidatus Roizmanbacteria bacterium CG_4_10_14_0_8_um_filter_39_9 TaxID=1974829 RepID=A0A2M7QDA2_9BACT|nr:MAG: signal peptidase I [Candidatus Roizmanbacteria bacterium CG_4_10_14_0_8_um_filter_39_9]